MADLSIYKSKMTKSLEALDRELGSVRAGAQIYEPVGHKIFAEKH